MDTTPRSPNAEPDRPDYAPRWFVVVVVVMVVLGGVWLLMALIKSGY